MIIKYYQSIISGGFFYIKDDTVFRIASDKYKFGVNVLKVPYGLIPYHPFDYRFLMKAILK